MSVRSFGFEVWILSMRFVSIRLPFVYLYSLSFDFAELRFCYVALHSSREAAADARSSRGEAGRCA